MASEVNRAGWDKRVIAMRSGVFVGLTVLLVCTLNWWKPGLSGLVSLFGKNMLMIPLVAVVAGWGCCSCVRAMRRLCAELAVLVRPEVQKLVEEGESAEERLQNCMKFLSRYGQTNSMLYMRLSTISKSIERGSMVDASRHVLPRLKELRDISLHAEMSRGDSSSVSTILSFLLVLGIMGTLTGVHGVLVAGEIEFTNLSAALLPSVWAVGGAILLMGLRAWYMKLVMHCLARLDELSMSALLPALSAAETPIVCDNLVNAMACLPGMLLEDDFAQASQPAQCDFEGRLESIAQLLEKVHGSIPAYREAPEDGLPSLFGRRPPMVRRSEPEAFIRNLKQGQQIIDSVTRQETGTGR